MKRLPPVTGCRGGVPSHWSLPLRPLLLGILVVGLDAQPPGWAEPKRYDPDPETCQEEVIRQSYKANLLPWEDQPAVVQQRLRQLQAAMTLDTLRNCQARGLLSPAQVTSLTTELQLQPPSGSETASPAPSPSPTRP